MTPTQRENLLVLADHLEKVPEESFYWAEWVRSATDDHTALNIMMRPHIGLPGTPEAWEFPCGTQGCALGHACTLPHFQRQGLFLDASLRPMSSESWSIYGTIAHLFGRANHIFFPPAGDERRGPRYVANLIREHVRIQDTYVTP